MKLRRLIGGGALLLSLAGLAVVSPPAVSPAAAEVPLPAPSPRAQVAQVVGVTQVRVDYSSPAVKGRKIFGGLVPFGDLWRTGADGATLIEFSTEATIGEAKVPAGTYALLTIPTLKTWTVILNSDTSLRGTRGYDEKKDVARIVVTPTKVAKRERMTFIFNDTNEDSTRLDLEWEETRISMPIQVQTSALTIAAIDKQMQTGWRPLANSARYLLDRGHLDKGLAAVDASIAIQETWFNVWIKARLHAAKNDYKGAYPLVEKAWELGNKDSYFFWKAEVQSALDEWKSRI